MNPLKYLLPSGRLPRTICSGPFKGLRVHLDLRGGDLQLWLGLYERETYLTMERLLRGCRSAIDVGAAKGELVLDLLRRSEIERIVAVEPAHTELERFRANLAANPGIGTDRLDVHIGLAGDGPAPLWRTLDSLAGELPAPIFVKIDIDGPEAQVLATGTRMLAGDCRLLIETHSPEAEVGCDTLLRAHGYMTQIIRPAWWRCVIPEHRPILHNRWLAGWRPKI